MFDCMDREVVIERYMRRERKEAREKGLAEGIAEGRAQGRAEILISLVKDGLISVSEAAARTEMSEEAFMEMMGKQ